MLKSDGSQDTDDLIYLVDKYCNDVDEMKVTTEFSLLRILRILRIFQYNNILI